MDHGGVVVLGAIVPLTRNTAIDENPTWRPDGQTVAFRSSQGARELYEHTVGVPGEDQPPGGGSAILTGLVARREVSRL